MRKQDLAPTIRPRLKVTEHVIVVPSLPKHHHSEGVEFAILQLGGRLVRIL